MTKHLYNHTHFDAEIKESLGGFKASYFQQLNEIEGTHFWFRSRNNLIKWAIGKYIPKAKKFLEIGCGTGFVLSAIEKRFPKLQLYGCDIHEEALEYAGRKSRNAKLFHVDARGISFENEYDVIGVFDVLEHIKEDELVLLKIYKALCRGGGIILTVPQHSFIWSECDDYSCHVRRYEGEKLKKKVEAAGFVIKRITSFMTLLFPLMILSRFRIRKRDSSFKPVAEVNISNLLNNIFHEILGLEQKLINIGISFPFGGSMLLVAHKI